MDYQGEFTGPEIDARLTLAESAYQKPEEGIPAGDLNIEVQVSLQKADSAYQKPSDGIPAEDLAQGVIPDVSNFITKNVDDLVNYYLKSDTYTKEEVQSLIATLQQFHYEVYASTADVTNPQSNVLYLIGPTGTGSDKYEEYVYPDSVTGWVKIGDTSIDLSGYAKSIDIPVEKGSGSNSVQQKGAGAVASGDVSFAEGDVTIASGDYSHAEGYSTTASGDGAHAEGNKTLATGQYSHSEGIGGVRNAGVTFSGSGTSYTTTTAHNFVVGVFLKFRDRVAKVISVPSATSFTTDSALSESTITNSADLYVVTGIAAGVYSHSEGDGTVASGSASHAEGRNTTASGIDSHAEGNDVTASGNYSHSEGNATLADKPYAHAEGNRTHAGGSASHTEGYQSEAGGNYSANTKTAGTLTTNGTYAHAEGNATIAQGTASHSEGKLTFAKGSASHSEGESTKASGSASHAEGYNTAAGGEASHAEGRFTEANGTASHVEGYQTTALGNYSHAEGYYTSTQNTSEHAEGQYNESNRASSSFGNAGNTIHSIGIGTSLADRKNAFEVMENGDVYVIGLGGYDGTNAGESGVQTLQSIISGIVSRINAL